ncbi:hypothetical protein LTR09_000300 [Extremus antarcticus]|uniref:5'-3' DNA helicase ZGRF1-like N-terminal domain-containing protein n=1 Tax=Extremus antarcticus TaxID=702011 RepID=A0AAJ0GJC9_9PEZI|nr:hypothetical protein LTR09_000300 [Extremus antarcticus]
MSAAVFGSGTPSLSIQQTQNTAPVHEYSCLWTNDLRRKQKRWQDGFLRFHTFNKRIMVYDVARNFIGDAHWKASESLQHGDEMTLEKGGVMVQVAERTGTTETDLTEIVNTMSAMRPPGSALRPVTQSKHRSLNALLGTPKGALGKAALPTKSPFEERNAGEENREWAANERPLKRQRMHPPPAWTVERTTSVPKPREAPLWARTIDSNGRARKQAPPNLGQQQLGTREVIDLSEEAGEPEQHAFLAGFSSDALLPPSSPEARAATVAPVVRSSSPAFQTQRIYADKDIGERTTAISSHSALSTDARVQAGPLRSVIGIETGTNDHQLHNVPSSPLQPLRRGTKAPVMDESNTADEMGPPTRSTGRTLKFITSAPKKKTLLCQNQLSQKPSRTHSIRTENAVDALLDTTSQAIAPVVARSRGHANRLEERLAKIAEKERRTGQRDQSRDVPMEDFRVVPTPVLGHININHDHSPLPEAPRTLAQLDRMILPPVVPPPVEPQPPDPPAAIQPAPSEPRQLRRVVSESNKPSSEKPERVPGAPVRLTPIPSKKKPSAAPDAATEAPNAETRQSKALPARSKQKKPLQRAVSLNVASNGTSTVILSKPFRTPNAPASELAPPPPREPEPWSREAFDLFTWRPPGWDEEEWCVKAAG